MLDKAKPPGIALIVLDALGLILGVISVFAPNDPEKMREALSQGMDPEQVEKIVQFAPGSGVAINILGLLMAGFVLFAGIRMVQGRGWDIGVAGSIVAMIPCWRCCILGVPIGIWSLIVLFDKDVKAAFAGSADAGSNPPPL
jgi:hypothetical protein